MKKYFGIISLFVALVFLASCKEDTVKEPDAGTSNLQTYTVSELAANWPDSVPNITYYSLRENKVIPDTDSNTTKWDIAFKNKYIYVNCGVRGPGKGGAVLLKNQDFSLLEEAPSTGYQIDTSKTQFAIPVGSGKGWYSYDPSTHSMSPTPGVVIVVKTADEKYAKIQILSYYKGYPNNIPTKPEDRVDKFYTFKYMIQMNGTKSFK